ncbi:MAG: DUF1189 family protein [Nanoarchaeota archaeon]
MLELFIKELISSANPFQYKTLCLHPTGKSVKFLLKLILISYIVFLFLFVPKLFEIPSYLQEKISHVSQVDINGTFDMREPVFIPDKNPWLVVDTSGNYSDVKTARIIFTKEEIKYRTLKSFEEIKYSELKNVKEKSPEIAGLLSFFALFILPSFIFIGYFILFLKYFLWAFVFGTATFLLLDLTTFSIAYKKVLNASTFALVLVVPIEIILLAINHNYLLPIFDIFKIPFYAVTLLIYVILYLFGLVALIHDSKTKTNIEI